MSKPITAFKAFNPDWTCRDFKFEVGKTYKQEGKIECCENGFHACENPLDTLNYYNLFDGKGKLARFAEVELLGDTDKHGNDTKIAAAEIHIKAELKLPEFIQRSIEWVMDAAKSSTEAASGYNSQLAASGNCSKLAASGNYSQLAASGYNSKLAASGNYSKLAASGYNSQLAASGNYSQLAASGEDSKLAASGNYSKLAASGNYSQLAASGYYSQLAASGYNSQLAASGNCSQLAASGNCSQLAASGNYSQLAASGNCSQLAASGEDSVIVSSGRHSTAKGCEGTLICLTVFNEDGKPTGFATGRIGKDGLKPDTLYRAKDGKLEEVA